MSRTASARIDIRTGKYLYSGMVPNASVAVGTAYRSERGRIVASLDRPAGDFDIDTRTGNYLYLGMLRDTNTAIDEVYRSDWGRIVATLIRLVGDFDVAEEAAQEAFATAVE